MLTWEDGMSRKKVLGVEVETDLPDPADVNTDAPGPAPGGFFSTGSDRGGDRTGQATLDRIADSLDGIRTELTELRRMLGRMVR